MTFSSASEPVARTRAFGRELVRVHQWLRDELARIHDQLDNNDSDLDLVPLQAHCVAFCAAITRHHTSEDGVAFPALAVEVPEIAAVLEELSQDHRLVADIVRRLTKLLTTITPETVDEVRREVDGLSAILESHFRWEEKTLVAALDTLVTARTVDELFGEVS
jgi:hemerythrin-like domain-containing protein